MKSEGPKTHPGLKGQARELDWHLVVKGLFECRVLVSSGPKHQTCRPAMRNPKGSRGSDLARWADHCVETQDG